MPTSSEPPNPGPRGGGPSGAAGGASSQGMVLDAEEVRRVARLARLGLDPDQVEQMRGELEAILRSMAELAEVDVSEVPPTDHVGPRSSPLREDQVAPSLSRREVLAAAPETGDGGFAVPRVLERES